MGVDREDFSDAANWQTPQELPDLRRVGIVALDTETQDEGLRADRGSSWPWRDGHVCGISVAWRDGRRDPLASTFRCAIPTATTLIPHRSIAG